MNTMGHDRLKKSERVNIRLTPRLLEAVERVAELEDGVEERSLPRTMRRIIEAWIREHYPALLDTGGVDNAKNAEWVNEPGWVNEPRLPKA